jgi:hypothetical protein
MAATDARSLLALAGSDAGYAANQFEANLIIIGLLRQILLAQNAMATTDAKTLLAQSACDSECGFQLPLIIIGLLRQIAINGSTGGGGGAASQIVSYAANPNTEALTPPNVNAAAVAVSPGKPIYTWTIPGGPWV